MEAMQLSHETSAAPVATNDPVQDHPVDLKHLRRYTLGDRSLEQEVLYLFLNQLPETISRLRGAKTDKDWRVAAHTIKGSGRAVGAWQLAHLAEQAERVPAASDSAPRIEAVARIEAAAGEIEAFITSAYQP